jgi:hypothetical protein
VPDRFQNLVFAHHPIAIYDQIGQEVKDLGLDVSDTPINAQFSPGSVKFAIAKS